MSIFSHFLLNNIRKEMKMKIKTINYLEKHVQRGLAYCEISQHEMQEIQIEMIRWVGMCGELSNSKNREVRSFINDWWFAHDKQLPKGRNGLNTPYSFISGIISNLLFGTQRDLSTLQMDGIERISEKIAQLEEILHSINEGVNTGKEEKIVFRIGVL